MRCVRVLSSVYAFEFFWVGGVAEQVLAPRAPVLNAGGPGGRAHQQEQPAAHAVNGLGVHQRIIPVMPTPAGIMRGSHVCTLTYLGKNASHP